MVAALLAFASTAVADDAPTSPTARLAPADIALRYLEADRSPRALAVVSTPAEMSIFFALDPTEDQREQVEQLRADYVAHVRYLLSRVHVDVPAALLDDATPPKEFVDALDAHLRSRFPVKQEDGGYLWTPSPEPVPFEKYVAGAGRAMGRDLGIAFQLLWHPSMFEIAFEKIVDDPKRAVDDAALDASLERLCAIADAREREHDLLLFLLPRVDADAAAAMMDRLFAEADVENMVQFAYAAAKDEKLRPAAREAAKRAVDALLEADEEAIDDRRLNALLECARALGDD